jgi:hypothetical protein
MYDPQSMRPSLDLQLTRTRVRFPRPRIDDVVDVVRRQLQAYRSIFPAGGSIAVAVGSRGIANIGAIVRAAVSSLAEAGLRPFVVPAMGSHGGATADGQAQLLADYGVSPDALGCDVRSSMDVVALDRGGLPHQLFMDRHAHGADGILLINRVKPHTDFHGRYESGLAKMAVIGLGKEQQAIEMHRFGVPGLRDGVPRAAAHVLATGKILAGLAIVENAYDETMLVEVVRADELLAREPELLEIARAHMPRLAVDALDVLVVDRLGKNISGTGLDTNVIGRMRIAGEPEPASPCITTIVVTDLTDASHGNATGTGLADVITKRLFDKIDVGVTYTNVFTSGFPERGKIPIVAPTDADAYACALRACGVIAPGAERVARIQDTLHLGEIDLSDAALAGVRGREDVTIEGGPVSAFDASGRLRAF